MALALVVAVSLLGLAGCQRQEKRSLDVPEGYATHTLKEFAKQANVEIVFNTPSVGNIKTSAVVGRMAPQAALESMLAGTPLGFERDPETGAYAVISSKTRDLSGIVDSTVRKEQVNGNR